MPAPKLFFIVHVSACLFEVFAFVALQEAVFHHDFVGEEQVNTSGQGVLVGIFLEV